MNKKLGFLLGSVLLLIWMQYIVKETRSKYSTEQTMGVDQYYVKRIDDIFVNISNMIQDISVWQKHAETQNCPNEFKHWKNSKQSNIEDNKEIRIYEDLFCSSDSKEKCVSEKLIGPLAVIKRSISMESIHKNDAPFTHHGGWWSPNNCKAEHVAIIVPFRKREDQLPILMRQLHPILYRQRVHYRIFVIEQAGKNKFNRAKLFNVGYKEATKYFPFNCFIFHDVDLIPEDDRIYYSCKNSPKHMSVAVSSLQYRLPYSAVFGGVSAVSNNHFKKLNGFSNWFWGWGAEDDNFSARLNRNGLRINRQSVKISRYTMLTHKSNRDGKDKERGDLFGNTLKHFKEDGLNSLEYKVLSRNSHELYTAIRVDLEYEKDLIYAKSKFNISLNY